MVMYLGTFAVSFGLALLVVIWLYQVVLKGNDGIYPYTSRILHIGRETLI